MCGIAGIFYADPNREVQVNALRAQADQIAHRGPDGVGIWRRNNIGLAHRRLSIIDLEGGDQPIANEDGSVQVVFNGEIYNFQDLRAKLISRGHRFATESDTEVLVHLYEEYGEHLVDHLRGMFAFAIWDQRKRKLLLARDRVGLKPLYVYRDREKLLFGSELKAILAHHDVDRSIDLAALEDYFCYGIIPGERSIFRFVSKLPPAHVLVVSGDDLYTEPRRYWQIDFRPDYSKSVSEWKETVEAKIEETVRTHEVSDVPVGAFLSGGVDSSVMVGLLSRYGNRPLHTFSIGFDESEYSELPYARQVAKRFGCEHIEEIVRPEAAASLDDLVKYYDEPFADSSAIPTMHVSRLASQYVKVVVSGDGGDEAFGGYSRYAHDLMESRVRSVLPSFVRSTMLPGLAGCWPKSDWLPRVLRAKNTLHNLSLTPAEAYANTLSLARLPIRRRILSDDVVRRLEGYRPERHVLGHYPSSHNSDALANMLRADIGMMLPDDFLTKVDRASMSCGLEVRPPLVDHELLELTARMPSSLKIRGSETKWIFKDIYRDRLPRDITKRSKRGFEIPIDSWLRGPLRDVFEDTVFSSNSQAGDYLDRKEVKRLYRDHRSHISRHGNTLWAILVFAKWAETYIPQATTADHESPRELCSLTA